MLVNKVKQRGASRGLQIIEYDVLNFDYRNRSGPLIGILANPQWDKDNRTLRGTVQLEALTRLVDTGHQFGVTCFLFGISGVDLRQNSVLGYALHDSKWVRRTFPMPDVIYDQLVSRKRERDPSVQDTRTILSRRYGNRFFNDGFFDKWQVFEWLKGDPSVKVHVPETQRHTTAKAASTFLNSHTVTFLKPLHGSLGLGIVRFVKARDGSISYELKQRSSTVTRGRASSAREVLTSFRTRLKNRPYIWQEGLTLATYEDRPLDIRILMQRDHTGQWKRTKMFARVAKSGDFTSNLNAGGDAMPVDEALVQCLPKAAERSRAKSQIRRLAQAIALAVEAGSGRKFGELGIDLGIDRTGKVWVIEVNSKPHKTPTTEKGRQDLVDLSFERPIRYAIYLAADTTT